MPSSITILSPRPNSTVPRAFTARGGWEYGTTPTIIVELKNSTETVVATGTTTVDASGGWTSSFDVSEDYSDASITATIVGTAVTASVGGITVSE